ncbi:MAG: TRAP transporter small permease [Candidatus Atribacteria bacterium]|nr:MAG: TRAP transporter small permease [Candidatus Atribacteria bacterium]
MTLTSSIIINHDDGACYKQEYRILKRKSLWLKIGKFLLDLTEVYIPAVTFSLLFIVFMIQVFYRYFLVPLVWPLEFTLLMFIWTTLFGACYAMRENSHVRFTMIYDSVALKTKLWMRVIGNVMILFAFIISFVPTYRWIDFMSFKKSDVLKIPMNIAFSPYLIFMVIIMGRLIYDIYQDLRHWRQGEI